MVTDNNYKAGNITKAQNSAAIQNTLGGSYTHTYTYDSLYRLTASAASKKGATPYTLNMTYLPDGRISSKYITAKSYIDGVTVTSTKTMTYSYDTRHAPYQVVTTAWDPNAMHMSYTTSTATLLWGAGRLAEISEGGAAKDLFWDEENRLVRYIAPDNFGYYKYDAGNERFYKCTGTYVQMTVNGRTFYASVYTNPVLYASQYLVITPTGYTKHYYAGNERIASRIGEGRFRDINEPCVSLAKIVAKKTEVNTGLPSIYYNTNNFTYLHTLTDNTHSKAPIYWTHGDHLGSTSWVTDTAGIGVQHFRYLPFGEPLYSKKTGTFSSRYTFSGKERDAESGLNYFGARYYNSALSIWLSVDPMVDKYPNLSPYTYCANNPVRLVDPDGEEPIKPQAGTISGFISFFNNTQSKMGTLKGQNAHNAMLRLGKTEWSWSSMRPMPATTNPINKSKDKYIYTKEGGWIDLSHFLFYAGRAYDYKQRGEQYPMGKALKDGLFQEMSDMFFAKHSAFSYEDLPSDKYGADFGANFFDSNSEQTLGEQLHTYFNDVLKATRPQNAPNYDDLPTNDTRNLPTRTNVSSKPVYTEQYQ